MKSIRYKLHGFCSEHVLYFSYRWLAWAVALLVIGMYGTPTPHQPVHIWMLVVFTGALNILLTAFAQAYVRVVRRRPPVLILDVVIGVTLIWLSGGGIWPFFPYALGALILPGMVLQWRGAFMVGLFFATLDTLLQLNSTAAASFPLNQVWRGMVPPLFALLCAGTPWVLQQLLLPFASARTIPDQADAAGTASGTVTPDPTLRPDAETLRSRAERSPQRVAKDMTIAAQLTTIRTTTERGPRTLKPGLFHTWPDFERTFSDQVYQLVDDFRVQNDIDVRIILSGPASPLTSVQQLTMFKLAQEALLNIQQHAHAHTVLLTVQFAPYTNTMTLTISDDGVGLLDGTYWRPGMHGLRILAYRLAEIDGYLEVFEGEHGGVTVRGTVPLTGENR